MNAARVFMSTSIEVKSIADARKYHAPFHSASGRRQEPAALRRFRSGVCRLRVQPGHGAMSAA